MLLGIDLLGDAVQVFFLLQLKVVLEWRTNFIAENMSVLYAGECCGKSTLPSKFKKDVLVVVFFFDVEHDVFR